MKHIRLILIATITMIGVAVVATVAAQDGNSANVEVRVWQSTSDAESLYISARPEGGSWNTPGTIPLDMSGRNSRGTFRYGDIAVAVPVPGAEAVDDSPPCLELAGDAAGRSKIDVVTCTGIAHEFCHHGECVDEWELEGVVLDDGDRFSFRGTFFAGTYGSRIKWSGSSYGEYGVSDACRSVGNWIRERLDRSDYYFERDRCLSSSGYQTKAIGGQGTELDRVVTGYFRVGSSEARYVHYFFEAVLAEDFAVLDLKLFKYERAQSSN